MPDSKVCAACRDGRHRDCGDSTWNPKNSCACPHRVWYDAARQGR